MVKCLECNKEFLQVTNSHIKKIHNMSMDEYRKKYPECKLVDVSVTDKIKDTTFKNYGVTNASKSKEILEKKKATWLEKYGVENPFQDDQIKKDIKKTNLEKYGVENPSQSQVIKDKKIKTCRQNYGVDYPGQSMELQEKSKQTCLEKYGKEYVFQVDEIQEKSKQTCLEKYGVTNPAKNIEIKNKIEKTCLLKYGFKCSLQSTGVINKRKKTNLEKYGFECATKNEEVKKKIKITRYDNVTLPQLNKWLDYLNLEVVGPYINAHDRSTWKCKKCNTTFNQLWNVIQQGFKCPKCYPRNNGYSKGEEELYEFLKKIVDCDIIKRARNIIKPLELDLFIPEYKLAIEFDGIWWHREKQPSDILYHLNKTLECEKRGIKLIHIFEDEWMFKRKIVEARLKQILNINDSQRIHARKCIIKEIDAKTKNIFLEQFHLQGPDASNIKLGAFYNNELISVMTFSKGNVAKGSKAIEGVWELNRFCSSSKYHIPGIASKLLSHFKLNHEWKEIFSYADRRWSTGQLYYKLNFKLKYITTPNYWYMKGYKRIHRFSLRKRPDEPKYIPEWLLRESEGYDRIWDCGNYKFSIMNNKGATK